MHIKTLWKFAVGNQIHGYLWRAGTPGQRGGGGAGHNVMQFSGPSTMYMDYNLSRNPSN